jgi:hypothetical protein
MVMVLAMALGNNFLKTIQNTRGKDAYEVVKNADE